MKLNFEKLELTMTINIRDRTCHIMHAFIYQFKVMIERFKVVTIT